MPAPGFNRWLIPPAALAIHLCIGQAYAFSVFKLPLNTMLGKAAGLHPASPELGQDWTQPELAWIFTIAIVFLGLSAAVAGWWLEKVGPRKSGFVAACCWSLGFVVSAFGVWLHQLWMLYLGYGVLGGCGLGLGYITPVSTLITLVPRPPRHGHGHGHHGFRRRRHDRLAPLQLPHGSLRNCQHARASRKPSSPWARSTSWP